MVIALTAGLVIGVAGWLVWARRRGARARAAGPGSRMMARSVEVSA